MFFIINLIGRASSTLFSLQFFKVHMTVPRGQKTGGFNFFLHGDLNETKPKIYSKKRQT